MKRLRKALALLLAAALILTLSGCRRRLIGVPSGEVADAPSVDTQTRDVPALRTGADGEAAPASAPSAADGAREIDPAASAYEDPQSDRRAYAQDAPARASEEAGETVADPAAKDGEAVGGQRDGAPPAGNRIAPEDPADADRTITETRADDGAAKYAADDAGAAADSMLDYYAALLGAQLGTLFECHRLYVYFERAADYETVNRTAGENQLILDAGAYNVAAKRRDDALAVTDEWVIRKNPGAIVKCVEAGVLGDGVVGDAAAKAVYDALVTRPGWAQTDAVRNRRVILISRQLLETQAGRLAAALHLAKRMYPELLADCDANRALRQLLQESAQAASGLYVYTE